MSGDLQAKPIDAILKKLTAKQLLFAEIYADLLNGARAAELAGYPKNSAKQIASENLTKPDVCKVVAHFKALRIAQLGLTAEDLVVQWADIAFADPSEIVRVVSGACRYCYGIDHAYHWRTEDEFSQAKRKWQAGSKQSKAETYCPTKKGGFGYDHTLTPHAKCPMCNGCGTTNLELTPSDQVSPAARKLLKTVFQTKDGFKITLRDQDKALEQLSKIKGIYDQPDAGETVSAIGEWIREIQRKGSKPPLKGIQRDAEMGNENDMANRR